MPPLQFHNTLSSKVEPFVPLSSRTVKMYNCGPTVYDRQHLGNMFAVVFSNTLRRALEAWGYKVNQVINITDFGHLSSDADEGEDKMSIGLKREGLAPTLANMRKMAEKFAQIYLDDIALLGVPVEDIPFPRASDYIEEQVALIRSLEQKGYAYTTSDGVYFDTKKFKDYGKLGNIQVQELQEGARVEANPEKKSPADFALWKLSKDLGWKSPWGKGFPGWHIECTAMIFKLLGKQIDIHTGGIEHVPVHHNNEIAQAEAATGKQFVQYWMHNAHITIEGKKISKSLGNTVYLSQIIDRGLSPRAFRYWVLTGHYRTPMNFTWEAIEGADQALKRLTRAYLEAAEINSSAQRTGHPAEGGVRRSKQNEFMKAFYAALANDLGTAQSIALMWDNLKTLDKATFKKIDQILGLGFSDPRETAKLKVVEANDLPSDVQRLVTAREEARAQKDFTRADELRTQIEESGYTLKDTAEGPKITKE